MTYPIHEERRMRHWRVYRVVDRKLYHWQYFAPIRKWMDVSSKDLFQNKVGAFRLIIRLRVVRCEHF